MHIATLKIDNKNVLDTVVHHQSRDLLDCQKDFNSIHEDCIDLKNGDWNWSGNYTVYFTDPDTLTQVDGVKEFDPTIFTTLGKVLGLGGNYIYFLCSYIDGVFFFLMQQQIVFY